MKISDINMFSYYSERVFSDFIEREPLENFSDGKPPDSKISCHEVDTYLSHHFCNCMIRDNKISTFKINVLCPPHL